MDMKKLVSILFMFNIFLLVIGVANTAVYFLYPPVKNMLSPVEIKTAKIVINMTEDINTLRNDYIKNLDYLDTVGRSFEKYLRIFHDLLIIVFAVSILNLYFIYRALKMIAKEKNMRE